MTSVAKTTLESTNCKGLNSLVGEITTQVDAELKKKIVQKKIIELESDQQSTGHSE